MLLSRYGGTFSYFENIKIVTTDQIHPSYHNWKLCRVSSMLTCLLPRCRGFRSLLKEGRPSAPGAHVSSWQGSFKGVKFSFFLLCPFRYTLMMKIINEKDKTGETRGNTAVERLMIRPLCLEISTLAPDVSQMQCNFRKHIQIACNLCKINGNVSLDYNTKSGDSLFVTRTPLPCSVSGTTTYQ